MWRFRLRVEDVLCVGFILALTLIAGWDSLRGLKLDEDSQWEVCFIAAPLALTVFLTSLRYAFHGGRAVTGPLREIGGTLRAWLPFLMFLVVYQTFQSALLARISGPDRDAQLLAIDRLLLTETPALSLQRFVVPWLTNVMTLAYVLHLVLPPVIAFLLYRREPLVFRQFLLAVLASSVLGGIGYLVVPATGPGLAYPDSFTVPLSGALFQPLTGLLDAVRAPRDVFPSLHVCISSLVLWFSRRLDRRVVAVIALLVVLNWISTMYLRYHYFIDVVAGWLTAVLSVLLARSLLALEARIGQRAGTGSEGSVSGTPRIERE